MGIMGHIKIRLVVTIDTEEDNQWLVSKRFQPTLENIKHIPKLQGIFDKYDVKPTYLVTYPVAKDKNASSLLRSIHDKKKCEIGTHLHNWTSPPFGTKDQKEASFHHKLPYETEKRKIKELTKLVGDRFGKKPVSFRAGRWGLGKSTISILEDLKYKVDTSFLPYTDWSFIGGIDFSNVNPKLHKLPNSNLLEVPASVGFNINNFRRANFLIKLLGKKPYNLFKIRGILRMMNMLKMIELNPEKFSFHDMKLLSGLLLRKKVSVLNLHFHSSSNMIGGSPFNMNKRTNFRFYKGLDSILSFLVHIKKVKPVTLSEFSEEYETS